MTDCGGEYLEISVQNSKAGVEHRAGQDMLGALPYYLPSQLPPQPAPAKTLGSSPDSAPEPAMAPRTSPRRALPLYLAAKAHLCSSLPRLFPSSSPLLMLSFPTVALSPSVYAHDPTCP